MNLGHIIDECGLSQFPYNIMPEQRFQFKDAASLKKTLRPMLSEQLKQFSLL